MKGIFWTAVGLGAGVAAAVLVSRWMRRQQERLSPRNMGRQAADLGRDALALLREAIDEGRKAMAEREAEIRASLPE